MSSLPFIDSHTEGEPTRVFADSREFWPGNTMAERADAMRRSFADQVQGTIIEPRGHSAIVGAWLTEPVTEGSDAGVIFFNNAGLLGMCGHGTIGVAETLRSLGRAANGSVRLDTTVGTVVARFLEDRRIEIDNVVSFRHLTGVTVHVPGFGTVTGDVAYGGNWFWLSESPIPIGLPYLSDLTNYTVAIRRELERSRVTGQGQAEIDHIEIFGPASGSHADSRNFVLCPGLEYDRSPCGTGTSAKVACLAADGKLAEGEVWRQESVIGSLFSARYSRTAAGIVPSVAGRASIVATGTLHFDDSDPFRRGISS